MCIDTARRDSRRNGQKTKGVMCHMMLPGVYEINSRRTAEEGSELVCIDSMVVTWWFQHLDRHYCLHWQWRSRMNIEAFVDRDTLDYF